MFRVIVYLVIVYTAICLYLYLIQHRMIYFPDTKIPNKHLLQTLKLRPWPTEDPLYCGLIGMNQKSEYTGTIVVFHGNAGSAKDRTYYMQFLEPLGFRVVLAEYPGYGGRPGKLNEQVFLADAIATVSRIHETFGLPIFLCGESLGCGVASGVAANSLIPINGIVLITPWNTLPNLAKSIYWFFPVSLLVRDKYDNISNLKNFQGRVVIAIAEHDEIIPKACGMRLYHRLDCDKRLWEWKGAGHNSWPDIVSVQWWKEALEFLKGNEQGSYP